jgi:septal ring factor EnvC (AmiA/AmiB activator)
MSDESAAAKTDLIVRLVLEAVDQRLKEFRHEAARISAEADQRQRDVALLASELGRWLTANAKAEAAMGVRVDELQAAVRRLNELASRKV